MSAFIVENKTINRILTYLELNQYQNGQWESRRLKEAGHDITTQDGLTILGRTMLNLNTDAVDQRYDEKNNREFVGKYNFKTIPVDRIQALKSLRCWIYQCLQGDIPEREFFKLMDAISYQWMYAIINDMKAFQTADWG